ncbi:uncharacterized protein LOC127570239 isoform X2 [Pristis pectinata]|nr:uncharacterized protein LOC127570239 isoform X2 [Pristis pectinata]
MKGFEVLHKGDSVTATQCTCKANYHCSQDCEYCLRDNPCFPGFEVKEKANRKSDTKCRPCPPMHFSNETSFTVKCKQRTNCTVLGLMEKVPGNATADAVCIAVGASTSLSSDDTVLTIVVGFACGCTILLVFICAIIFHRKTLAALTDAIQQRFTHAWCSINGRRRNEGNPPVGPVTKTDNHNRDPESELFLQHSNLVEARDQSNGSIFCTFAESPDCSPLWNPYSRVETLWTAKHSPNIPKENPDAAYYIKSKRGGSSTIVLADANSGISLNPLTSVGYEMQETIHSDPSTQGRNSVYTLRNCQKQTLASGSTTVLSSTQSGMHCAPKHDCHVCCQNNSSSSAQEAENINDSSSHGSDHTNPGDENGLKSGNSVPSGFSRGSNMMYNTSGQSVSNAGGSVIFNVIVKVNNSTDEGNKGGVNGRAKFATEDEDERKNFRGSDGFPIKEEKPVSMCGFEVDVGLPVQEQSKEAVPFPVQEEQTGLNDHRVNFPIQEQRNSRQSLKESLILAGRIIDQDCCYHPRVSAFPMQEDGKSEHLPKEEENQ